MYNACSIGCIGMHDNLIESYTNQKINYYNMFENSEANINEILETNVTAQSSFL